jgi:neutral ceramidase
MDQSILMAGVALADITPPLEVGLLTSSVKGEYGSFESVRTPLKVRVLVLRSAGEAVALVSMDLLALNDTSVGGWSAFKKGMSSVIPAEKIILTCTHTHNAPESVALSDLYLTEAYRQWLVRVQQLTRQAIETAMGRLKPCSLSLATSKLKEFSLQRRIPVMGNIIMSDLVQPISAELMEREPVDKRVHTLRLQDAEGNGIATVVHAICHPVHEMCMPHISADYPGEMCLALEAAPENGMPLFLNGAAGDTNPPTVSLGPEYARHHGQSLARIANLRQREKAVDTTMFRFAHQQLVLAERKEAKMTNRLDACARLSAIRIGSLAILFLPGEPFVETALAIEKSSPFEQTIVVGFGENNIGYIPTEEAFSLGGYEVGPGKWSFLEKGADKKIYDCAMKLLEVLYY